MKVIFLDIDGVLNCISQGFDEYGSIFHKHFEDNLKTIIDKTGAKIVISSTWRSAGLEQMQSMWIKRGLPGEIIDITPMLGNGQRIKRGYEIKSWLDKHSIESYCIIDDDTDMLESQLAFFVRTSDNMHHSDYIDVGYGLTIECAYQAISILMSE